MQRRESYSKIEILQIMNWIFRENEEFVHKLFIIFYVMRDQTFREFHAQFWSEKWAKSGQKPSKSGQMVSFLKNGGQKIEFWSEIAGQKPSFLKKVGMAQTQ